MPSDKKRIEVLVSEQEKTKIDKKRGKASLSNYFRVSVGLPELVDPVASRKKKTRRIKKG